jgi:hypothetical protein
MMSSDSVITADIIDSAERLPLLWRSSGLYISKSFKTRGTEPLRILACLHTR